MKQLTRLFIPICLETLFYMLSGMVDTLMLSAVGDYAVGAVGTANSYIGIFIIMFSIISSGMLMIASYLPERSLANGIVFLLIGIVQLLQLLRGSARLECISLCVCIYLLVSSLMSYWEGSYDIYRVHKEQAVRDAAIENSVNSGNMTIGVPIITSTTKYSCKYGLLDLNGKDADEPFPNVYIAKYYGLDKIYVIYPDLDNE